MSGFLTRTVPLRAAFVSIDQYGKAKQATVGRVGGEGAALGLVEQDKLVVDADVFGALVHNLCIRRLDGDKFNKLKHIQHPNTGTSGLSFGSNQPRLIFKGRTA